MEYILQMAGAQYVNAKLNKNNKYNYNGHMFVQRVVFLMQRLIDELAALCNMQSWTSHSHICVGVYLYLMPLVWREELNGSLQHIYKFHNMLALNSARHSPTQSLYLQLRRVKFKNGNWELYTVSQ